MKTTITIEHYDRDSLYDALLKIQNHVNNGYTHTNAEYCLKQGYAQPAAPGCPPYSQPVPQTETYSQKISYTLKTGEEW